MALLATWLLAADTTAQTQSATGNLYGTALDTQGTAVVGVTVTVKGPGAAQIANTDGNGDFHFLNLSPGDYSVTLERTGLETVRRSLTVVSGKSAVLSITMPVAGATEAVTVSGDAALDSRKIQTGATYGQKELESIPTTRDPWAVLRQVPGVLFDGVNVGGGAAPPRPVFVGKGSHPDQNSYELDGVAISLGGVTPIFFDFDSLSNIEVATGGSDPSLETPGVTLSLVTKRGTNRLLGSARALYTGGVGWDYGIEAGGPLWKDRLWLWGAGARNAFLGYPVFLPGGETLQSQATFKNWNAKLNAELLPANTLTLAYTSFERFTLGWLADPDRSLPSNSDNVRPGRSYKVEDSQVFSPRLFASLYLSSVTGRSATTPKGGLEEQADQDPEDGIWLHSYTTRRILDDKSQAGLNVSAFFDTGSLRHELKLGFGYKNVHFDSASSWPGDLLVGYGPAQLAGITRLMNHKARLNAYDVFVGDTLRAGSFTVNVGGRFDYQQGRNLPSVVPANPVYPELLPAVLYAGDSGYPITWRQFQPRAGVTYALRDNRTLLRASYSRFANQLDSTTVLTINAFPDIAELDYVWNDTNGNVRVEPNEIDFPAGLKGWSGVDPDNPGSSTQINQISTSLKTPTTDEFIAGVERQIFSDLSGSLAYTYRISRNLVFFPLIGTTRASYQYFGNVTGTARGADGFVLNFSEPYYGLTACPDPCAGNVLENRLDANETYNGVEFQLLKSFSHGWMARVSFAYNDWLQHIGRGAIINPNNEVPGTNASGPVVESGINATWQFNVSGMVELPLGIAAGVNLFGRQGFPIDYFVEVATGDPKGNVPLIQIGPVTRYRTPNVYVLDVQISKAFRIGSAVTVVPEFDCFNLLNSHTVMGRNSDVGFYDAATQNLEYFGDFNTVAWTLPSRTFRGGVRISF